MVWWCHAASYNSILISIYCHIFIVKSLHEPMMIYCQLHRQKHIPVKFGWYKIFQENVVCKISTIFSITLYVNLTQVSSVCMYFSTERIIYYDHRCYRDVIYTVATNALSNLSPLQLVIPLSGPKCLYWSHSINQRNHFQAKWNCWGHLPSHIICTYPELETVHILISSQRMRPYKRTLN